MREEQLVEIRRARLRDAIDRWCEGNQAAFGRKVGRSPSQISDMLSGGKSFGAKVARMLEEAMRDAGLPAPPMYLDGLDRASTALVAQDVGRLPADVVTIAQLDVHGSMGHGTLVQPHEDVVELMHVHVGALLALLGKPSAFTPGRTHLGDLIASIRS